MSEYSLQDHVKECSERNVAVESRLSKLEANGSHMIRLLYGFIGVWAAVELFEIDTLMGLK